MKLITNARQLMLIWLAWAVLISAFQFWSSQRVKLTLPDNVLRWTASESNPGVLFNKRYLNDPFLNEHVAWDSEYYLSIAMEGYDDPEIRGIPFTGDKGYYAGFCIVGESSRCISLSHGFFPLYPLLMRALAAVLAFLPISAIARFTLAGVLVSLLGTLAAMFALRQLMDETTEETDRLRAVFYLLVFPGAIFLAQVYSEGGPLLAKRSTDRPPDRTGSPDTPFFLSGFFHYRPGQKFPRVRSAIFRIRPNGCPLCYTGGLFGPSARTLLDVRSSGQYFRMGQRTATSHHARSTTCFLLWN